MAKPQNVVLVGQNITVVPRQGIKSKDWNDHVRSTTKDCSNIKTQLNGLIIPALKLHENAWIDTGDYHGIDANTIYWDSTAAGTLEDPKLTIAEKVTAVETTLDNFISNITASIVKFDHESAALSGNSYSQNLNANNSYVQKVLEDILLTLPSLQEGGQINIGLGNLTIDGDLVQPAGQNFSIGTDAIPWSSGFFNTLVADNLLVKTTTTLESVTVSTGDKNILLASEATAPADADGGGITLKTGPGTSASITWNQNSSKWNFTGGITVDGEEFSGASDAADVTYNNTTVEATLDEMDQTFTLANTAIKRVPTEGLIADPTNSGMTVKEWLTEVFFPQLDALVSILSVGPFEKGTTQTITLQGAVDQRDENQLTSLVLSGGGITESLPASNGPWSKANISVSDDTLFTITLSAGSEPAYDVTASTNVQFFAPTYYVSGGANMTWTDIKAAGSPQFKNTLSGSGSFTTPNGGADLGYFYIVYPAYQGTLTSILDPNGFENIGAVKFLTDLSGSGTLQDPPIQVPLQLQDGTVENYYVYRWKEETAQAGFVLTFS